MPLNEFLKVAADYQLGSLDTESQHPFTTSLSQMAHEDVGEAVKLMHQVDVHALRQMQAKPRRWPIWHGPWVLRSMPAAGCFSAGVVPRAGCRSALRFSAAWAFCHRRTRSVSLPSWPVGDLALIKAIETFEDHPEYGARQLEELGFVEGDLLIAYDRRRRDAVCHRRRGTCGRTVRQPSHGSCIAILTSSSSKSPPGRSA
jgi:N-acetylmuramic acid 6-phosphate etherase